jgi:hypothetical protein
VVLQVFGDAGVDGPTVARVELLAIAAHAQQHGADSVAHGELRVGGGDDGERAEPSEIELAREACDG